MWLLGNCSPIKRGNAYGKAAFVFADTNSGQILITATFCAKIDEQRKKKKSSYAGCGLEISATNAGVLRKFWMDSSLGVGPGELSEEDRHGIDFLSLGTILNIEILIM